MSVGDPGRTDVRVEDSLGEDDECQTHRRKRVSDSQSECREGKEGGWG